MLISEEYRALNEELHSRTTYGSFGSKWTDVVAGIVQDFELDSILDYGCGKGTLKVELENLGHRNVAEFDPAIPGKTSPPSPADLVVCTDVLEHIEPELLENVVADLKEKSLSHLFLVVATRPAKKTLADGRNAHLIIQDIDAWMPTLSKGWAVLEVKDFGGEFAILLTRKDGAFKWPSLGRFRKRLRRHFRRSQALIPRPLS